MHILVVFALCWTNTWKNHIFQYFEWILLRQQIFTAYTLLQFVCLFQNAFKIDFLHDYQFKYLIFIKNKTIFLWKSKNSPFWDPRRQYPGGPPIVFLFLKPLHYFPPRGVGQCFFFFGFEFYREKMKSENNGLNLQKSSQESAPAAGSVKFTNF